MGTLSLRSTCRGSSPAERPLQRPPEELLEPVPPATIVGNLARLVCASTRPSGALVDYDALIRAELGPMRPYAPGLRASEVRELSGREDVRKLSSNENPYGPLPGALAGMRSVLGRLNVYPDGSVRALKRRLCEHLGISEENLVVGNGSNELLRLIAQAVLAPGDECVFAWPSFVV